MTATRRRRLQRATAVVPLALVSAAWTASLVGPGTTTVASTEQGGDTTASAPANLPDGSSVPSEAIEAPASISRPSTLGAGVKGRRQQIVRTASTNAIPSAALAAYQRAETVINAADESCKIPWQLIAAIGRVESDHGRANGNTLDDDGLARPGIYGIALNGSNKTSAIRDTDAGQYDNDRRWDRAVGPMQFIPSTWAVVGVDADGDGQRDPQDVDDAALATAVYLCSGDDDLSELPGQRASIFRYNHSKAYVDLVISVMNAYLNGDYTSVPTKTASAGGPIAPDPLAPSSGSGGSSAGGAGGSDGAGGAGGSSSSGSSSGSSSTGDTTAPPPDDGGSTPAPTDPPDSSGDGGVVGDVGGAVDDVVDGATSNLPGSGGGSGGSGGGSGGSGGGSGGSGGGSGGSGGGSGGGSEGGSTMSKAEATAKCLADNPLLSGAALAECVSKLMG